MRLDPKTIMWVIENLTNYDHEYDRGPRAQSMTFRKGGEDHDFSYFFAEDIREWLASELHQVVASFLPKEVLEDQSRSPKDLTHRIVYCTCGWTESFEINHKDKTWLDDDAELSRAASAHVHEEVEKIMERFRWE